MLKTAVTLRLLKSADTVSGFDSDRTRCLFEEARKREIRLTEFYLNKDIKDFFVARFKGKTRCFEGLPRPIGPHAPSLYWMDNKPTMRKRFQKAGIPVAKGFVCFSKQQAREAFTRLSKPLIAKPHTGSRSRHTTVHLKDVETLLRAFHKAKRLSPWVLIEEELQGFVFRGTLINGKLAGVCRREPPHVIGDGIRTVRELVEIENKRPERRGPTFHPIDTGPEADEELKRQKLSWTSIPAKERIVTLNQKVSRGVGASTTDMTDETHPENRKLLEKIGVLLQDPLVGVDFIIGDVTKPWFEQECCGIIECNSLPFIDLHHYPLNGLPRNIAGELWNLIFPESGKNIQMILNYETPRGTLRKGGLRRDGGATSGFLEQKKPVPFAKGAE